MVARPRDLGVVVAGAAVVACAVAYVAARADRMSLRLLIIVALTAPSNALCEATVYDNWDFSGSSHTYGMGMYTGSTYYVDWKTTAESAAMKVVGSPYFVYTFTDTDFGGVMTEYTAGEYRGNGAFVHWDPLSLIVSVCHANGRV